MTRIVFTGGGTAGHVTPNIALIERLQGEGWEIDYIGSSSGIERQLIEPTGVTFHSVATGKLRRYFSWQNFIDPIKIAWGLLQAIGLCLRLRPDVVFSKGGFVAVPVVLGAWICRIPVIAHESDTTPGLATRLCAPFATRICVNFEQTISLLPAGKGVVTGSPVRRALLEGNAARGRKTLGLGEKPVLLVFGGSLGANAINVALRGALDELCEQFEVVHAAGAGNVDPDFERGGYHQFEYITEAFGDVMAAAEVVIARAGANSLYELLVTRTPHLLIPLPRAASRGDQIENAEAFVDRGMSHMLLQEELSSERLLAAVNDVWASRETLRDAMSHFDVPDTVGLIVDLLKSSVR